MFVNILIGLAIVIILLVIFIALRPSMFSVARSATMSAPPGAVFAQVNDFHKWEAWSPWAKMDPNATSTFEGPPSGKGAKFHWDGNKDVGAGNMIITESMPNDHIRIRLEFIRPFAGVNDTLFTFKPIGNKTNVTWTMSGKYNFIMKAVSLFMDCEKMVGPQFEKASRVWKKRRKRARDIIAARLTGWNFLRGTIYVRRNATEYHVKGHGLDRPRDQRAARVDAHHERPDEIPFDGRYDQANDGNRLEARSHDCTRRRRAWFDTAVHHPANRRIGRNPVDRLPRRRRRDPHSRRRLVSHANPTPSGCPCLGWPVAAR